MRNSAPTSPASSARRSSAVRSSGSIALVGSAFIAARKAWSRKTSRQRWFTAKIDMDASEPDWDELTPARADCQGARPFVSFSPPQGNDDAGQNQTRGNAPQDQPGVQRQEAQARH